MYASNVFALVFLVKHVMSMRQMRLCEVCCKFIIATALYNLYSTQSINAVWFQNFKMN